MASYEFPNSSSSSTTKSVNNTTTSPNDETAPLTNGEAKKHFESVKKILKDKQKEEKKETEKEKKEREKRAQERKEKLEKIWTGVKGGFARATDKVSDLGEDVSSNITQEVFGSGLYANQMNNIFGKAIRGIAESLKRISSFLVSTLGKIWHWMVSAIKKFRKIFSRNGLFGTIFIYFRWMRMKLTNGFAKLLKVLESIKLFSLLGKLLGGIGSAVKGTLNVGGDLIKSLIASIVGTAAWKALVSGISSLGSLFSKISLSGMMKSIAEAIIAVVPRAVAGVGAFLTTALWPTELNTGEEDELEAMRAGVPTSGPEFEEWKENRDKKREEDAKVFAKAEEARYYKMLKEYPTVAKEILKAGWLNSDKNNDGLKDYDAERLAKFDNVVQQWDNPYYGEGIIKDYNLSEAAVAELKAKTKNKHTAKVSST